MKTILQLEEEGRTEVAITLAIAFGLFACVLWPNTLETFLVGGIIGGIVGYSWCSEDVEKAREKNI